MIPRDPWALTARPYSEPASFFVPERPAWQNDAACRGAGTAFFFEQGGPTAEALAFCRECPVKLPCRTHAMENDERHGIWGGTSARQRDRLKRGTRRKLAPHGTRARYADSGGRKGCRCELCREANTRYLARRRAS